MRLHENEEDFRDLCSITAGYIGIPEDAVRRDYYIVSMLQKLEKSEFADCCVFKGGTSLSKCYPGSIERFSEDIDLTFLASGLSKKQYDKSLKKIEKIMTNTYKVEIIPEERNDRNKSSYVFFGNNDNIKVKLEIGSSVRPDPYSKRVLKTYIQEYLEKQEMEDVIAEYELKEVVINVLAIERTFLDKVMSVKRHAICGTLGNKVRHIYDVTRLFQREDIQEFLKASEELKSLLRKTKDTDSYYLQKRNISEEYDPTGKYDFNSWKEYFNESIQRRYETLHEDLLYTDQKQNFEDVVNTFEEINRIFAAIDE